MAGFSEVYALWLAVSWLSWAETVSEPPRDGLPTREPSLGFKWS